MALSEMEAKVKFREEMEDPYDYPLFRKFCIDNGYMVTPFIIYASLVEPQAVGWTPPAPTPPPIRGAGDVVAIITKATKVDKIAEIYTAITGKPCGCKERQEALNKLIPFGITE